MTCRRKLLQTQKLVFGQLLRSQMGDQTSPFSFQYPCRLLQSDLAVNQHLYWVATRVSGEAARNSVPSEV
jgi:hypothetical protein